MTHSKRMARKTAGLLVTACAIAALTSGCSLLKSASSSEAIDPPPAAAEAAMMQAAGAGDAASAAGTPASASAPPAAKQAQVTLYMKNDSGLVSPVSLTIPETPQVAQRTLELMTEDGLPSLAKKGFTGVLPKGTKVKGISIDTATKTAVVDFSREFTNYNPQDERKILEAVTWALTSFSTIDSVKIRVEGKDLKEMPVDATPLDHELTRAMGINLEIAPGVDPGQSTAVTLYFQAKTGDGQSYYVPVTRMVKRTEHKAEAALDEMVKGPTANKGLTGVFAAGTRALQITQSEDHSTVTVDFNSKLLDADKKVSPDALQTAILTLAENTGAGKIQVSVNGDSHVTSADSQSYSKPVAKPAHINPLAL